MIIQPTSQIYISKNISLFNFVYKFIQYPIHTIQNYLIEYIEMYIYRIINNHRTDKLSRFCRDKINFVAM